MKQAFWIQRTHLLRADEFICSACKRRAARPCPMCPACGVKMTRTKYVATWVDEIEGLSAMMDDDW